MVVGGKVDVLGEAEAVDKVQKVHGIFTVRGVNVQVEITRSKTDGEIEESAVMNSESSGRNDGLGLGGAVDDCNNERFWAG